ncbi:uncharacterized protein LOC130897093 isoform X3 [Diorhabda carinulata]|uniref:uncharacterized protein LOC130441349 isoform X3 n=1 Tax=Diorhabda sublineata TaxID=1163346 RepID=UPI0024E0E86F|nr:uncharacterized protein LOC130441349 isoform X3 [Diorhabda sublineata]XP_057661663.1 uncharacterized protein LOC130897093 isoform X3 [Diorhabda carinulata]
MAELQNPLPPGWDCRRDAATGKLYYINHYTKTTTWEDPRGKHRIIQNTQKHPNSAQNEYIPMQHGTPESRRNYVYPRQNSPIPAFQMPTHMTTKSLPLQDMKPKISPLTVRSSKVQDSSLNSADPEEATVAKIAGMFPTVPETHIKMLLKNCRYMKSIFPQADEMIILDILQNNDSNIQKTSEILKDMGYVRKDTVKIAQQKLEAKKEEERKEEQEIAAANVRPPIKNSEDKKKIKAALQDKYKDIAEHLICIALESVNFDEERANQIIQIMIQEDQTTNNKKDQDSVDALNQPSTSSAVDIPISQSRQSLKSLLKTEKELEKTSYSRLVEEESSVYKSPNLSNTRGPNPEYAKGANEKLLLEDYMKWQGPNSTLSTGSLGLAKGHNPNLLSNRGYKPMGPNRNLIKGPQCGLSKGSIFSQFKTAVFVGETRGD